MCFEAGCAAPPAGADGRCLAHVDDEGLRRLLADAGRSRPLDARDTTVTPELVGRILTLAPRDAADRPLLRSVVFDRATFAGPARFPGVAFGDASFDQARFEGGASFDGAVFDGQARFGCATFGGPADFADTKFESHAWFSGASFASDARFEEARFGGPAWFGGTAFERDALFGKTTFGGVAGFGDARFGCHAAFLDARFDGDVSLATATFNHQPRYDGAQFRGPSGAPRGAARQITWAGAPLAPWTARAAAALLDAAAPAALLAAVLVLPALWGSLSYGLSRGTLLALALAVSVAITAYNLVDQGHTGQTPGKRRLGLSLVRKGDGQPVGPALSLLRYGLHVVDTVPLLLGWLAPLWSDTHQTFSDRITATVVVQQRGYAPAARPSGVPASGFG